MESDKVAYCQQVTKEEMEAISKKKTADELLLLGAELQSRIDDNKKKDATRNLVELDKHISLSNMLNEYFDLDPTHQKARMLDLLTKLSKLETTNHELSVSVDTLDKKYQDAKDLAEEMTQQCTMYIDELNDKDGVLEET